MAKRRAQGGRVRGCCEESIWDGISRESRGCKFSSTLFDVSTADVSPAARAEIARRLDTVEENFDVRVIFACESGSRAWGFASTDSDYDVRFLYVHRTEWYLSVDVEDKSDVIETPIEDVWDVNGWDLRKALQLFRKSNPPLLEWLRSPIVYREVGSSAQAIRALIPEYHSPMAAMYHYLSMAKKNYRNYLQNDLVRRKKYFYTLRPLLACRWLEMDQGAVPMEFQHLVAATQLTDSVRAAIESLLVEKRAGTESDLAPPIPELHALIEAELARLGQAGFAIKRSPVTEFEKLNDTFRNALREVWV